MTPSYELPTYKGADFVAARLPRGAEPWISDERLLVGSTPSDTEPSADEVIQYVGEKPWVWPGETVNFLCDVHADADAFLASVVATGAVARTGVGDFDFELLPGARGALFVLGGDYLDKGPSNLRLLRVLRRFLDQGARVELLAGNHDLRTVLGLKYAGAKDPKHSHLFVRMGQKSLRLFKEVYDEYVAGSGAPLISEAEASDYLLPPESWYSHFREEATGLVPEPKIDKELVRIREKRADILRCCVEMGLSLPMLHAALERCRELFLTERGEFAWLGQRMKLAYRAGSFLFVHAGLDDEMARLLHEGGTTALNDAYAALLEGDPFTLYNGPVGNAFRTKYRNIDFPFTSAGLSLAHRSGTYAIVHGHRNLFTGQRIMMRAGMLNFECDASVDVNTRKLGGATGLGAAATIVRPDCHVLGISADHPRVKVFDPSSLSRTARIVRPVPKKQQRPQSGNGAATREAS